jgi:8-oxo-dGTP diphosphatase
VTDRVRVGSIQVVLGAGQAVETFDAVVVLFASGKVVLVRNVRRAWEFPGGRREDGESYQETAVREVFEETGATISDIEYLGHYVAPTGQITVITCAEALSFQQPGDECRISDVGLFDELPADLSFGDGREQLFLEHARERALRKSAV